MCMLLIENDSSITLTLFLVCLVSQNVIFFIFSILSVIFGIALSYAQIILFSNVIVNYTNNCNIKYVILYVCMTSLIILLRLKIFNKAEAKHGSHLKFKTFALSRAFWRTLPVQQRINPGYWSYFCFPLSGMACKLQVKFLLPFNKPLLLPSREFTPCGK